MPVQNRKSFIHLEGLKPSQAFKNESDGRVLNQAIEENASAPRGGGGGRTSYKSEGNALNITQPFKDIRHESPWSSYRQGRKFQLDRPVTTVAKKSGLRKCFFLKSISGPSSHEILSMLHFVRHDNFLAVHEYFFFENIYYIILDRMFITLSQLFTRLITPIRKN